LKDLKAAKKIIKIAKKHPEYYTKDDIKYAKMVKKRIKRAKKHAKENVHKEGQEGSGGDLGVGGE